MAPEEIKDNFNVPGEVMGQPVNEWYYILRDLFAGTISGVANLLSGHPFE